MKRIVALLVIAVLYLQPATVAASAYSPLTFLRKMYPPGVNQDVSGCGQAAMIDTAMNYYQSVTKHWVDHSCSGSNINEPAGYIGSHISGFRSGLFCGQTPWSFNNVSTSAWQYWAYLCDNPSGTQWFYSTGASAFYDNPPPSTWYYPPTVDSPVVSY